MLLVKKATHLQTIKTKSQNKTQLANTESQGLVKRFNNKDVNFTSDERYIKINIDNKYQLDANSETYVKTNIVKDKKLKTTETHIKKIILHFKEGKTKVIIREIFIDRFNKQSKKEHRSIYLNLDSREGIADNLNLLFEQVKPKFLLN